MPLDHAFVKRPNISAELAEAEVRAIDRFGDSEAPSEDEAQEESIDKILRDGYQSLNAGDTKNAKVALQEVIRLSKEPSCINPEDYLSAAYIALADALSREGDYEEERRTLAMVVDRIYSTAAGKEPINPKDLRAHLEYSRALMRFADKIEAYEPNKFQGTVLRRQPTGEIPELKPNHDRALNILDEAIQKIETDDNISEEHKSEVRRDAYYMRAGVRYLEYKKQQSGMVSDAKIRELRKIAGDYTNALLVDETSVDAHAKVIHSRLGRIYTKLSELVTATPEAELHADAKQAFTDAIERKDWIGWEHKNEAMGNLRTAIGNNPDYVEALRELSKLHTRVLQLKF